MSPKYPKSFTKPQRSRGNTSSSSVVRLDEMRLRHELPRILPAFESWCEKTHFDRHGAELTNRITAVLENYARVSGSRMITFLDVQALALTLDELMFGQPTNDFLEMSHVLGAYLQFLHGTNSWTGTPEEFQRVSSYFDCFSFPKLEPDYSEIPLLHGVLVTVPRLSQEEVYECIANLPLTRRMQSFFRWFGPRREITGAKILTRKHVQEAAKSLDVEAVYDTARPPKSGSSDDGPTVFTSARHVTRLSLYWDAMVGAGLIDLSTTRAYPSRQAISAFEDPTRHLAKIVRRVAQGMYRSVSVEDESIYQGVEIGYLTRYFLLEAAVEPISVAVLKHPIRGLENDDPRGNLEAINASWKHLEKLRPEGLIGIDSRLSVPNALIKPLVLELAGPSAVEFEFAQTDDDDPDFTGHPASWS